MKKKKKPDWESMAFTNTVAIEALINVLEKKGVLKKEEVLKEIKEISGKIASSLSKEEK